MFGGISRKPDPVPVKDNMIEVKRNTKVKMLLCYRTHQHTHTHISFIDFQ